MCDITAAVKSAIVKRNPLCNTVFTLLILISILQVVNSSCKDKGTCRRKFSIQELKTRLTPLQYRVTQEHGTEWAFSGALLYNKLKGKYNCRVCDNPLFSSEKKYDSGTGWPSFFDVVGSEAISLTLDTSAGMVRNEVSCFTCGSHLGHVFDDGPQPTGKRYCMNSAALKFKELKKKPKLRKPAP